MLFIYFFPQKRKLIRKNIIFLSKIKGFPFSHNTVLIFHQINYFELNIFYCFVLVVIVTVAKRGMEGFGNVQGVFLVESFSFPDFLVKTCFDSFFSKILLFFQPGQEFQYSVLKFDVVLAGEILTIFMNDLKSKIP